MSGTVYPLSGPRGHAPRSECAVYDALRDVLPDDWTAWHSLRVRDGRKVRYEADFVVASPEFGLLVLEVKGGRVEMRDGHWYQNDERLERSPCAQADHVMHAMIRELKRRGVTCPPYGAAVVLPDAEFTRGPQAGDLAGAVIGKMELPYLAQALRAVARNVVPAQRVPDPALWADGVHKLWGDAWVPTLTTGDRAVRARRRMLKLDEDQLAVIEVAGETPRAVVTGAAGTGKTLVARELCLRRAGAGQQVLYVCFTRALGETMRRDFLEAGNGACAVEATNVRQLAVQLCGTAGVLFDGGRPGAWEEVSLRGAEAFERLGRKPYDLVVVDEAFDLDVADWLFVEKLSGDGGLWAFVDPRQHFWPERALPKGAFAGAARLNLPRQHRNPTRIQEFAERYAPGEERDAKDERDDAQAGDGPEGSVRIVVADAPLGAVAAQVRQWRRQGADPADIAIVTVAGQTKSDLVGRADLDGEPLAPAGDTTANERVVADTFLRFKGFERPFVIVTELGGEDARTEYDTRMYIALTRATAEAVVVCTEGERRADVRLGGG